MGMTIDEAIGELQKMKLPISKHDLSFHLVEHTRNETLDVAIETMRKYQQIEQIYREWFSNTGRTSADAYERIGEVLKNGNDD